MTSLPYAHLNLRRNPFGWLSEDDRAELACVDVGAIIERLRDRTCAVQFVGEKGFGKTTHLLAIRRLLPNASYAHLATRGDLFDASGDPVIVDEAQRLTRRQRRQLFGMPVALVLGTHVDLMRDLRRSGREVVTVAVEGSMSQERLQALLQVRVEHARRGPGHLPMVTLATAGRHLQRHGPDVRAILDDLYLHIESMTGLADI